MIEKTNMWNNADKIKTYKLNLTKLQEFQNCENPLHVFSIFGSDPHLPRLQAFANNSTSIYFQITSIYYNYLFYIIFHIFD